MEKLASLGMLPAGWRFREERRKKVLSVGGGREDESASERTAADGGTVGSKDVGEDSPQVLVVRQLIDHLGQTARSHLEEGRQTPDDAGGDEELGDGSREEF